MEISHLDVWVAVHPAEGASPESLRALGEALAALAARDMRVAAVVGVDRLLAGRFPPPGDHCPLVPDPDGEFEGPAGRGRYSVPTPWKYCRALIRARRLPWEGTEDELVGAVRAAIPPGLGTVAKA